MPYTPTTFVDVPSGTTPAAGTPPLSAAEMNKIGAGIATADTAAAAKVASVTAANATVVVAGTATAPTVAVGAVPESAVTGLVTDLAAKQDTSGKGAVSGYAGLDAGSKVPIAQLPTGTSATTVAIGNDTRLADARNPTVHATSHATGGSDPVTAAAIGAQPVDADLTAIAALTATTDNVIQSVASGWASRTPAQVKATLALAKADVGLGNADNTADTAKPVSTATASALALKLAANDASVTNTRTPTAGSVVDASVSGTAAINADKLADGTTLKILTATERTKLVGVATGATANSTDAALLARANHTGTQAAATVTGLAAVATSGLKADVGLGSADNTADTAKPVSTAQQTALNAKAFNLTVTAVKTASYTAAAGELVPVDSTSVSPTITLPTAPAEGTRVAVKHVVRPGTNTVGIACAGTDVLDVAAGSTSTTLTVLNHAKIFQYKASTGVWYTTSADLPLSQLDLRFLGIAATISESQVTGLVSDLAAKGTKLTPTATKTAAYTAVTGDLVVCDVATAPFTVTLPAAAAGLVVAVRKDGTSANAVTIARAGTDTIGIVNTQTSITLDVPGQSVVLYGLAGAWLIVGGGALPRTLPDVQVFTTSGTWTKPGGATTVSVTAVAGGGGGGSGARLASGTASSGGAGGGGGGISVATFQAVDLAATEAVAVGAGGAGGAARTVDTTAGAAGGAPGSSVFGTSVTFRATNSSAGQGGASGAGSTAGGANLSSFTGGSGGVGVSGAAGATAPSVGPSGSGGGAGGGISVTPAAFAGGNAGSVNNSNVSAGGSGAVDTAGGAGAAVVPANTPIGARGGGGGGSSITTLGGTGGAGGFPGGGGGGGGSSLNGFNSGAGGTGGPGIVVVIST